MLIGFPYECLVSARFVSDGNPLPFYPSDEYWKGEVTITYGSLIWRVGPSMASIERPIGIFEYTK